MITIYDIAEVDNQTAQEAEIVDKYLQKIGLEDLLTPEEEQELLGRAVEGNEEAADKVMRANLRFVVSLSNQYQNKGLSLLQLFEISMQGLADAIKASVSKQQDEKFIKFAVPFMRQAIEEQISALDNCSK
jgi:RNA polymerase primary sigma factor